MPDFGTPFSGLAHDRSLTHEELIRAIRFMVAAEYEAVQLYMQLAESTDNKLAIAVLEDIANEERVHAGEFLRLLKQLSPDEEKFYSEGAEEVEEEIDKLEDAIKNPSKNNIPSWLLNRRADPETNEDKHVITSDLRLQTEFDIKRLKKIKSYKGLRHAVGLPVRGQKTKSNFRKNKGKAMGVKRKKKSGKK